MKPFFTGPSHTINRLYLKPTVHDSAVDILLSAHDLACKLMWPLGNVASTNCCLIVIVKVSMVLKLQSKYCEAKPNGNKTLVNHVKMCVRQRGVFKSVVREVIS